MVFDVSLRFFLYLFLALCTFLFRNLPPLASRTVLWPSPFRFTFYSSLYNCGYPSTISYLVSGPCFSSQSQCIPYWFMSIRSPKSLNIFSVHDILNVLLNRHISKDSISDFSVSRTVQVSVPFRATFRTRLFISEFLMSKLTVLEVKRFIFLM